MASEPLPEQDDGADREQPFLSHLVELRQRLLRALLSVLVVLLCLMPFANTLYAILAAPLLSHLPSGATMIATEVAAPFLAPFKLTVVLAAFVAMPYILFQTWQFVAPGLYRHEQRFALPLMLSSVLLFYGGAAFAYFIIFPIVFGFLTGSAPEGVTVMTDISRYLDFVLKMFFAFGLAFEIPVVTVLLVRTGLVEREQLARWRPYVLVGAFLTGALLTPPDPVSQALLAVPMWLLFEVGLLLTRVTGRREQPEAEAPPS